MRSRLPAGTISVEGTVSKFTISQLKSRLVRHAKRSRSVMAPLLYQLRSKIKAQGSSGEGFGAWVESHLDMSRRTADRWADEWAIAHGLKKPPKRATTSGQLTKSPKPTVDGKVTMSVSFIVDERRQEEFVEAMDILGEDAEAVIFNAVTEAAAKKRSHARHTTAAHA
jgi:ribonuclease BN (tRNA processing enzyme)